METPGPVPVGEPRYVHFLEGTTLLPGKWDGPIQVMAIEHKPDNMTVFIRPYLPDYDSPEELRQVPTQKNKPVQGDEHYLRVHRIRFGGFQHASAHSALPGAGEWRELRLHDATG